MNKLFYILVILAINIYCSAAAERKIIWNCAASKQQEAVLKQLEKYYPYLWEMEHEELKQCTIGESSNDITNIYTFKIKEIKPNGALSKRLEIAQREGFFDVMEKVALIPDKCVVDLFEYPEPPKILCVLFVCKYIYYLKILRYMEQEEWSKAIHELTVWANVNFSVFPNAPFLKAMKNLIEHLLLTYKIPDKERTCLIELKKQIQDGVITDEEWKAKNDTQIKNSNITLSATVKE